MTYFLSPALTRLRDEINALWPRRDRSSDGWIGDASHQARPSDHNPDWSAGGIVRAIDVDEDLTPGGSPVGKASGLVAQIIRDPRVAYVIYEGRIWQNPAAFKTAGWRPYSGANAHAHHVHVSVRRGAQWDRDASSWGLTAGVANPIGSGSGSLPGITTSPIPGAKEADDMFDDTDRALLQNVENLLARGSASGGGIRGDIAAVKADVGTVANELRAGLISLGQQIRAGGVTTVDARAIAASLADLLGPDLARDVVDELRARLAA